MRAAGYCRPSFRDGGWPLFALIPVAYCIVWIAACVVGLCVPGEGERAWVAGCRRQSGRSWRGSGRGSGRRGCQCAERVGLVHAHLDVVLRAATEKVERVARLVMLVCPGVGRIVWHVFPTERRRCGPRLTLQLPSDLYLGLRGGGNGLLRPGHVYGAWVSAAGRTQSCWDCVGGGGGSAAVREVLGIRIGICAIDTADELDAVCDVWRE